MHSRNVFLVDAAATRQLGQRLAGQWLATRQAASSALAPILLLQGDLGAGKTCLVQGLAQGLGISEPITSPSFALAQHYGHALVHLDLYRLEQPAAADELLAQEEEEARASGALLAVEWPERLSSAPAGAWRVLLELAEARDPERGRIARITAPLPAG